MIAGPRRAHLALGFLLAFAAPAAQADRTLDLTLHDLPVTATLAMRTASPAVRGDPADRDVNHGAAAPSFSTRLRDLEERVIFRFQVGYVLEDSAPARREYTLGDAALGTRSVLLPSLSTYFLSQFHFDADGATRFSPLGNVHDARDGRALLVHAGYAELAGMGDEGTLWHPLRVRAGRQFRYGAAWLVSQFDGLALAYDTPGIELAGFMGRRVAKYLDEEPGALAGASARLALRPLLDWPAFLALDFLSFAERRQYLEGEGGIDMPRARVTLLARWLKDQEDQGLARLAARLRLKLGRRFLATVDAEEIFAREDAFDALSQRPRDVLDVAETARLGLPQPEDATRLRASLWVTIFPGLEAYLFGKRTFVHGEPQTGFATDSNEVGLALSAMHQSGLGLSAKLKERRHALSDRDSHPGGAFSATSGAGASRLRELAGEIRFRPGAGSYSAAVAGALRTYDLATPYVQADADSRWGGRVELDAWMGKTLRLELVGEAAEPSPVLAAELGTLLSARMLMEATF